ncbi:MAG TPA: response regulator [Planctomycetota bacterium]|nr:response regulator [Planctomycetota bacterium]
MVTGEVNVKTIVVVDDEPDICDALEMALALEGYRVRAAQDRDTALRLISEQTPAMILLDFRMPGLDANSFILQLKESGITSPVVLMTAGKDPGETAKKLGLDVFLPKPFELDVLLETVRKCIPQESPKTQNP